MGYSMSREKKRARIQMLRKTIAVLFALCVILFVADIVCVFILLGKKGKSKPASTETTPTSVSIPEDTTGEGSDTSSASESAESSETTTVPGGVEVKEYLRMRDDHKKALKKIKQQIGMFCMRHGYYYEGTKWTIAHLKWIKKLELSPIYQETLDEYLTSYEEQTAKIERFDARIEEIASQAEYAEKIKKLGCFLGLKTHTALSLIVETGDFRRFAKGNVYAAYLGLTPGEHSSAVKVNRLGITKAGNSHLRLLLVEAASGICKGAIGHKSKALKQRQQGNSGEVIAYADKANARLRSKYYRLIRHGKKRNVAVAAVARELACFVWGMMTDNIDVTAA